MLKQAIAVTDRRRIDYVKIAAVAAALAGSWALVYAVGRVILEII